MIGLGLKFYQFSVRETARIPTIPLMLTFDPHYQEERLKTLRNRTMNRYVGPLNL